MLNNSEDGSAKTNLCACNAPLLQDINFSGVKDELKKYLNVQIFATDIDEVAIENARKVIKTVRRTCWFSEVTGNIFD